MTRRGTPPSGARSRGALIVHVEYTSRPPGRTRGGARVEDPSLQRAQLLDLLRRLAPARVGAGLERAEVRARRVDQHAVVAARRIAAATRPRPRLARSRRRAARRSRAGRSRAPRIELDRHDLALVPHQRREVGRLRARARRTGRAPARPGCGSTARATSIDARDCGISAPRSNSVGAVQVVGVVEHDAPRGGRGRGARRDALRRPARQAPRRGVARSVFTRAALSAGSLSARISATRVARARAAPTTLARPTRGCEWRSAASAGVDVAERRRAARLPSRAARRSTAFTKPCPRLPAALARSTDSVDRGVIGDAVHEQELVDAEPQRREHRRRRVRSAARSLSGSITWSSVARRCTTP